MAQRLLNWGGKFALEIAPLLGLAGKPAAETTSCCLSTVATANRAQHATPSYFLIVCKQTHYDDTRGGRRGGWRNGPSGRTFGWRNWQDPGAVRSAFMTSFKRNPQVSRLRIGPRREHHRRIPTLHTGRCWVDSVELSTPQGSVDPRQFATPGQLLTGTILTRTPSSAASRWTLANMHSKPPGGVQEKLGG